ncbi:hypothetical protein [Winogradskyella aurantia]|uniref:Uncharacterized protein n=1 Tax=Winogradskyella aurantia TaxID=1915063 RepID=A0A265UZR9_9FLAO|nr:hypothetical protein [Winogradskyella aurantia]OZV70799.1 hypothetical protein CA834_01410 [Winogradskyella aurantia]
MKVTKDQIQQLYAFTQKHYVEWYDVQTELVDHLANGIEDMWQKNPELSFEKALQIEFKKFGVTGFSDVVEQKTNALNKHYRKMVWKYFIAFFKLPKVVMTLFLIWVFHFVLVGLEDKFWFLLVVCLTLMFFPFRYIYKQGKIIKRRQKQTGKKWLFESTMVQLGGLMYVLNIGIYISIVFEIGEKLSNTKLVFLSAFLICFGLCLYVSICIVAPKLKQEMLKQYPNYQII